MCGIAGIFCHSPDAEPVDTRELRVMQEAMLSRGPDGEGTWLSADKRIGLTHRRLTIIDLSDNAAQPMVSADGRYVISYNGEIYNYRALRRSLEQQGYVFRTNSDTEVLLHLYDSDGAEMLHKLRGMFAIALWDVERRSLFLARDGFGIKPLCISDDGRTLRFASQVKALLASAKVDDSADPAGHVGFLTLGYVPDPHTLHKSIRPVEAGTWMKVDCSGKSITRPFFSVTETLRMAEQQAGEVTADFGDVTKAGETLKRALFESVSDHLTADVPVGVFLSAGLDSATILAHAAGACSTSLRTVTMSYDEFKGTNQDEAPIAELVAEHYNTQHRMGRVSRSEFQAERGAVLAAMDQPSVDGLNVYQVSKITAGTGLKVALSGLGGDELFAGYSGFRDIPTLVAAMSPLRKMKWLGKFVRLATSPFLRKFTSPKYAGLVEYGGTISDAYLLRRALFMPWELSRLLGDEFFATGWAELQLRERLEQTCAGISSHRLKISALELSWYMRCQLLRDADWAGMANSVEIRVPFVDVELFGKLAPLLAMQTPPTKQDMARTPDRPLPSQLLHRPKSGFVVPVRDWLYEEAEQHSRENAISRGLRGWALHLYAAQNRCFLSSNLAIGS